MILDASVGRVCLSEKRFGPSLFKEIGVIILYKTTREKCECHGWVEELLQPDFKPRVEQRNLGGTKLWWSTKYKLYEIRTVQSLPALTKSLAAEGVCSQRSPIS